MLNIYSATVAFIRIFAAYYFVETSISAAGIFSFIGKAPGLKDAFATDTFSSLLMEAGLGSLAQLLIASLVWIYAKRLATFITRDLGNDVITLEETNYELIQAIGFSILGMYLLIHAIPATVRIIASYAFPAPNNKYDVIVLPHSYKVKIPLPDILSVVVQVGLGLWLLLGSQKIASFIKSGWSKGRTLGQG